MVQDGNRIICRSGRTEQECEDFYDKGDLCNHIYMIDTDSDEPYSPRNCMYYQQYMDWVIAEEIRRNPPEEEQ